MKDAFGGGPVQRRDGSYRQRTGLFGALASLGEYTPKAGDLGLDGRTDGAVAHCAHGAAARVLLGGGDVSHGSVSGSDSARS
jgi:hypothetical protein